MHGHPDEPESSEEQYGYSVGETVVCRLGYWATKSLETRRRDWITGLWWEGVGWGRVGYWAVWGFSAYLSPLLWDDIIARSTRYGSKWAQQNTGDFENGKKYITAEPESLENSIEQYFLKEKSLTRFKTRKKKTKNGAGKFALAFWFYFGKRWYVAVGWSFVMALFLLILTQHDGVWLRRHYDELILPNGHQ